MNSQDEIKIRAMIKGALDKETAIIKKQTEKEISKQVKNSEAKIKKEYIEFVKKEIVKIGKKILTKEDIKDILIKAFIEQNRFMWEKSSVVTQYMKRI